MKNNIDGYIIGVISRMEVIKMYLMFAHNQGYVKPLVAYDDKNTIMSKCISIDAISDLVKLF